MIKGMPEPPEGAYWKVSNSTYYDRPILELRVKKRLFGFVIKDEVIHYEPLYSDWVNVDDEDVISAAETLLEEYEAARLEQAAKERYSNL